MVLCRVGVGAASVICQWTLWPAWAAQLTIAGAAPVRSAPPAPMSAPTRPRDAQWGLWPCPAICQTIEPTTIAITLAISPQCISPPVTLSQTLLPGRPFEFGLTLTLHAEPAAA